MKKAFSLLVSFAVGLAVGVWCPKPVSEVAASLSAAESAEVQGRVDEDKGSFDEGEEARRPEIRPQEEVAVPPPTVEAVVDNSPAPEPETLAAHAVRQARRRAAREAKENERHEFLSALNLDLLTVEQRKTHALYVKATETRAAARKAISALRAAGKEVPAELQSQLADAESVLCADREAEQRALREAAARAAGLDEAAVQQLMSDLSSIESSFR